MWLFVKILMKLIWQMEHTLKGYYRKFKNFKIKFS